MRISKSDPPIAIGGSSRAKSRDLAACLGCLREAGKVDFNHRTVIETKFFHVHQDCEVPIPGFLIVDLRRHVASLADFTAEEAHAFIDLVVALKACRSSTSADRS